MNRTRESEWVVVDVGNPRIVDVGTKDPRPGHEKPTLICRCHAATLWFKEPTRQDLAEMLDNAHLFAAAPELLAVAKKFLAILRHKNITPPMDPGVQRLMEEECAAAVAKAEPTNPAPPHQGRSPGAGGGAGVSDREPSDG